MKSYILPALTVGLLTAGVSSAQAVTIKFDDFTQNFGPAGNPSAGNAPISSTANNSTQTGVVQYDLGNGLGNITRAGSVTRISGPGASPSTLQISDFLTNPNQGRFDNVSGVRGRAVIQYTFGNTSDLTSSGSNNGLRLTYATNDNVGIKLNITVVDNNSVSSTLSNLTMPFAQTDSNTFRPVTNFDVFFSQFTGVDFTQVNSVTYEFENSTADGDLDFSFVAATAVPEPLTILGTLLAGGIGVVMKKKKSAEIQE